MARGYDRHPNYDVYDGTASDSFTGSEIEFSQLAHEIMVIVESNPLTIKFYHPDGSGAGDEIDLPTGDYFFPLMASGFDIKNATAQSNSDYQVIGFISEVEDFTS